MPTRGENFLDLILTDHPNLVQRTENLPGLADHDAVYMEFQIHPPKKCQPQRQIPVYNEQCIEALKQAATKLDQHIMATFNKDSSVEAIWAELRQGLKEAVAQHVPHQTAKSKYSLPWIDQDTRRLIKRRDCIHKRWKTSGNEEFKSEFKHLKRQVQKCLRRSYWPHVENLITESDTTPFSSKKFWGFIKSRGSEGQGVAPLKDGGRLVTDPKEKAQLLNKQSSSTFNAKTSITEEDFVHRCPAPPDLPDIPSCPDLNITKEGVRRLLHDLNPSKACGPDGVTPRLLRSVADEICASLTLLFRASYKNGILPKDWKTAFVTPSFKKGERYKPVNYRTISLTCTACKLWNTLSQATLWRTFRSTTSYVRSNMASGEGDPVRQLLGYVDETTEALEKGCQVDTVVLDFSNAFDKVSHALLVHKLKRYQVEGLTGAWIEDFLSGDAGGGSHFRVCPGGVWSPSGLRPGPIPFFSFT